SYASTAAWKNNNAVDDSWFYNSSYQAKRPTPRTGDVALHGGAGYTAQLLADTFVAGRTYTFTIHLTGDADATGITDRTWMYLYDGTAIPDATLFTEGSELVRARYLDDGTNDSFNSPTGTGATSGTNSGWSRGSDPTDWSLGGGTWGTASISYTATATDDGKQIGIALWGAGDTAWDDASVTSVPEPTSAALLGLGGLALILRRKK
ncbi:MAG: PEP-CTERM sorting domain-containing protein, partial [Akkermansiaceae bacterium]